MSVTPKKQKLIHDCDPGQDDAVALIASLASPAWDVVGVTVVGGNVNVEKCAKNARKILALCGYGHVPVYEGAAQPLQRKLITLESVFGESGLAGGDDLPDPGPITKGKHAVDYLVDILSGEEPFYICATAPLTNLALALQRKPEIAHAVKRLVIMGGCVFPEPLRGDMGNIAIEGTAGKAEYNFAMDPEAAQIVFSSNIRDIALVGLNVTRKVLFNSKWQKRFYSLPNKVAHKAADILSVVGSDDQIDYGYLRTSPNDPVRAVHDVLAALYLDRPDIFETQSMHIRIVTGTPPNIAGQSLPAKIGDVGASRFPVTVVTDCNPDEVFAVLSEKLSTYSF
jgi:purine nucleosidase